MLHMIMRNDDVVGLSQFMSVPSMQSDRDGTPVPRRKQEWAQVIDVCLEKSAGALVDAGALLAGKPNREIAEVLREKLLGMPPQECRYRGVVFFDVKFGHWRVLALDRQEWPKSASPIPERECFALFDEIRCRGADLKLAHDTVAVVTVGAKMCKDKLMQAAGRMRRLTEGQKLVFAPSSDVVVQIRDMTGQAGNSDAKINVVQVLEWVMRNTVQATMYGMIMHTEKGMVYASSLKSRNFAKLEDVLDLQESYNPAVRVEQVCSIIQRRVSVFEGKLAEGQPCAESQALMQKVLDRSQAFGSDFDHQVNVYDEECERELEREQEQEEEQEIDIKEMLPLDHSEWDYSSLLTAEGVSALRGLHRHKTVAAFLSEKVRTSGQDRLGHILWPKTIICTKNFMETVGWKDMPANAVDSGFVLNEFLRPAEVTFACLYDTAGVYGSCIHGNTYCTYFLAYQVPDAYKSHNNRGSVSGFSTVSKQ